MQVLYSSKVPYGVLHGPHIFVDERGGIAAVLFDQSFDGTSNNDTVGELSEMPRLFGLADIESDSHRHMR